MVKERMDLLELLRKGGMDGDVDFLRDALRVLVEGIMDAEVSSRIGAEYGERSPERVKGGEILGHVAEAKWTTMVTGRASLARVGRQTSGRARVPGVS